MSWQKVTWQVEGMHCIHCERAVADALSGMRGIKQIRVDYTTATMTALWDRWKLPYSRIQEALRAEGYGLRSAEDTKRAWMRIAALALAAAALYMLLARSPAAGLLGAFPMAREGMGLGALFLVGVMTSVHCVAMCGGINLSQSASASQRGEGVLAPNLLYQAGRVLSYAVTGAIVGALGGVLSVTDTAKGVIQTAAALFMLLMVVNLMGGFRWSRRLAPHLPKAFAGRVAQWTSGRSSFFVGLANGLMPCGPLQSMQLFALSAGGPLMGGLSMLSFALGTVPLMLAFGVAGGKLNERFQKPMRVISAGLVLLMGMSMASSGLALMGIGAPAAPRASAPDNIAVLAGDVQNVHSELDYGSYPVITVQAGVPVVWTMHADEEKITGCNNEIVIPQFGVRVSLQPGDNVIAFTPEEAGTIPYSCWMGMIRSSIQVVHSLDADAG